MVAPVLGAKPRTDAAGADASVLRPVVLLPAVDVPAPSLQTALTQ